MHYTYIYMAQTLRQAQSIFSMYPARFQLYLHPLQYLPPSTNIYIAYIVVGTGIYRYIYSTGKYHSAPQEQHSYPAQSLPTCELTWCTMWYPSLKVFWLSGHATQLYVRL